jgi:signal transduction histidine kinase/CheY-like chemotaxis protein/HPt (histidine-containing phosphotransfer) domain-containing protein
MSVVQSFVRKIQGSRSLYTQLLFVMLAFTLMVVSTGIFVNNMLEHYLKREAENKLTQTQTMIMDELREPQSFMIHVVKEVRDIIKEGGGVNDMREYFNEISAELSKREAGFLFDGLHGYFEVFGNAYISAPGWTVPDDYIPTERPWYKAAVKADGKITITPVYISRRSGDYQINYTCRIFDDYGVPLGVVTINMGLDNITKFVADMRLVDGGYGFLADENFELIAHHETEFVTKYMNEISPGFRQIVKLMEQKETSSGDEGITRVEEFNYMDISSVFYCKRIDNGWYLGLMTPRNIYNKDLKTLMMFLGFLGIILMSVVSVILIRIDAVRNKAQTAIAQMEKTIEEKDRLSNLGDILNSLDTMIYVSDPDTNEILFMNNNMKEHYNIKDDIIGQLCYKVLQKNMNEKCDFCPCFRLNAKPDSTIVWEEHNTLRNRFYNNVDRYIDWPNGKKVHLQHSIDITNFRTMTDTLNKNLQRQSLMTHISQSFLSTEDIDILTTKVLKEVGEFMGIDQILLYVTRDNEKSYICMNEWINSKLELPSRINETMIVNDAFKNLFSKVRENKLLCISSNEPEVRKTAAQYRVNFQSYIMTFVFLGDELSAIIDFSSGDNKKQWNDDEINLVSYVSNVLTGAMNMHEAELQLVEAKEAAEESNRSKGIFLAHMSHEIRTPMNAILGISEIQLQNKALLPDTEEALKQIYDSGSLLLNIINDILDFSKIEAGKLEIIPAKYNIPSLLNDTVQLNLLRFESKPIEFKLDLDKNTPFELYGDELRIKQIMNNLLSNAFKYTDKGEIKLSVFPEEKNKETVSLVFRVSDTGQGMSEDQIARLFDEYSRFNMETNRTITGTGLGMSIVKGLVEMMGGEISVESKTGKGSTFTVRLPQENISSAVCGTELADSLRNFSFHSTPISKKTQIVREYMPYGSVLVVDDVASNLYVAKGLLAPYGLRVETAASGTEAIEKIKSGQTYDIVFMDHMMPVMDGIEALKIIRKMGYTPPVVALTANAVVGQSDIFLENGFDGFVSKPIDSRKLDAALKRFIRDKQPQEVIEAARKEQQKKEAEAPESKAPETNDMSEIYKYFVLDGEKAIKTIEKAYPKLPNAKSVSSYVTAVHGMKNVLANIGEANLSAAALRLEQAGNEKNFSVIKEETPAFKDALQSLIDKHKPALKEETKDETTEISSEDTVYLKDKLIEIKTACEAFDVTAAKNALEDMRKKTWPRYVNDALDEISVHLLHSAFKKAEAVVEKTAKK